VPEDILLNLQQEAKKAKGPIPVNGTLQGKPFTATLVKFRGLWRLYINNVMRKAASVEVGDQVTIELEVDRSSRNVSAPPEFTLALSKNKPAREAFQKLIPSRQKEILLYLNNLKQAKSLERNIERILQFLQDE
jgi:uncharacterized protein YdeI (YjbR/CyaY-like superfamily)